MAQRARKPAPPLGLILYEGPSMLDGAPIVVIATGLKASRNAKTGAMVQTWILRQDRAPHVAVKDGSDAAVCGDCPHRPALAGSCYVTTFQGPRAIWEAYTRGRYQPLSDANRDWLWGRALRLGSYGDPAAAPLEVWQRFVRMGGPDATWTGYTHQWRTCDPKFSALLMASADSVAEGIMARAMGWRTFRVRQAWETLSDREFVCPASAEAGHKTDCASCKACGGTLAKAKASPVIIAHGSRAHRFALYANGKAA